MTKKAAKDYASTSHKGLPNKKESMKITKERLKELVKEVMTEESEYQAFFQKALDKAGKGINDMNDDEKKAFFNKIDTAWNGKGEKNEGNAFGAAVSKAKEDGDDSFEVDGEEYKVESVSTELPTATIPSGIKMKLSQAIDKIKDAKLNPTQKLQLLAQIVDSLGMDKSQLGTITSKIKSKMESVNEGRYDTDLDKIEAAVKNASSFMSVGAELKKAGIKYDFTTSMIPMYMIKVPGNTIAICNKKYAAGAEREVKDIAIGLLENKK
jgi:hypothetical protein